MRQRVTQREGLARFTKKLKDRFQANLFIVIRHSASWWPDGPFKSRPEIDIFDRDCRLHHTGLSFVHQRDFLDELGDVYGQGNTPDEAFVSLLKTMQGKMLMARYAGEKIKFRAPKDLAS